jgi:hypothetical protein
LRNCRTSALAALDGSLLYSSRLQNCSKSYLKRWNTTPVRSNRRFLTTNNKPGSPIKQAAEIGKVEGAVTPPLSMWKQFLGPKVMPERWTFPWYREMVLLCTVFAITGSSTMVVVSNINELDAVSFYLKEFLTFDFLGSSCSFGRFGLERKFERWSMVLSNLLHCCHDTHLCYSSGDGRNSIWATRLLSPFFCENVE